MQHSILGASKAARWFACPASVMLEQTIPDTTSFYMQEGTAAHALGEHCLLTQKPPENYLGVEFEGFLVDEEMAQHVATYVDFCNSLSCKDTHIELRVDYSKWASGGFGTADFVGIEDGMLHIADLKYGAGVKVDAYKNPQLMLYALGAAYKFMDTVDTVSMSIVQPRMDNISTYSVRAKELFDWADDVVRPAALAALSADPAFNPTPAGCKFCKAKATCRALAKHNYDLTLSNFDDLEDPLLVQVPHTLNADEIANLLPKLDALIGWATGVQKHAHSVLTSGGIVPGYKLVASRGQRKWLNHDVASEYLLEMLGEEAFTHKLISPAQAEKALGKARSSEISNLWQKPSGRPTLAPDSDPRSAIAPAATAYFTDIEEEK